MALRAFWEQESTNGVTDRVEVYDSEFSGTAFQFEGDETGFNFSHSEITSESTAKLLNVHANPIQKGRLDFRPRIESSEGFSLLEDIRDASDGKRFHIVHKEDGDFAWCGYITSKVFSYPERDNNFVSHIRAIDFEWMEGEDYTLDDTRQTLITTIADLLSGLPEDVKIKTATSWITENTTNSTDFLSQVYHETKALRDFARTGDETDQPIKKWDALHHMAEPALLIRQHKGYVFIDQLTELADPSSVHETIYNADGSVNTATTTVDRRQTGYKSTDDGTPLVKVTSQNHTYPAIKQAQVKYDHRTKVTTIKFPSSVLMESTSDSPEDFSQFFISDGDQQITFMASLEAQTDDTVEDQHALYTIEAGSYYWDEENHEWVDGTFTDNRVDLTDTWASGGKLGWMGSVNITTDDVPADADGPLVVTIYISRGDSTGAGDYTEWKGLNIDIVNAIADENSTSIDYKLTQTPDHPNIFKLDDTWFGDLPTGYSVGALRYGSGASDLTADSWQRRGSTSYRNYHENKLKESIDLQRTSRRKIEAHIYGDYDPSKVLSYDGSYFYYAGGNYDGTVGRWAVTLFELNIETGTDDFDDIPKFSDETGSGSGSSSIGGGGSSTVAWNSITGKPNSLSDWESETGLEIDSTVQAWDAALDTYADNPLTASELGQLQNIGSETISSTQWGYLGAMDQGLSKADNVEFAQGLFTDDLTIGSASVGVDLHVYGNIFQDGDVYETHVEQLYTEKDFIISRDGAAGGLASGDISGLQVNIADGTNDVVFGVDNSAIARVGWEGDTLQAIATRPDSPDNNGLAIWNATENWIETDSNLTFDGSVLSVPSLAVNGQNLFPDDDVQALGTGNRPTWDGANFTSFVAIESEVPIQRFVETDNTDNNAWWRLSGGRLLLDRRDDSSSFQRVHMEFNMSSEATKFFGEVEVQDTLTVTSGGVDVTEGSSFVANNNVVTINTTTSGTGSHLLLSRSDVVKMRHQITDEDVYRIRNNGFNNLLSIDLDGGEVIIYDDTDLQGALTVSLDSQFGDVIQSDHYDSSTGWQMSYAGDLEGGSITNRGASDLQGLVTVHDDIIPDTNYTGNIGRADRYFLTGRIAELYVPKLVVEEHLSTTGGVFYTGIGTVLTADISAGATSIEVENNNLSSGDYIRLYARSQYEKMKVTSSASGTGPYTYSVTRDVDGSGANAWNAGDGVFNTGGAAGFGFIEQYATNSLTTGVSTSGPSVVYQVRTGTDSGDIAPRAATGNLNGWYGYSSDTYGAAFGDEDGDHVTIDPTDGIRFLDSSGTVGAQFTSGKLTISAASGLGNFDDANTNQLTDGANLGGTADWSGVSGANKPEDNATEGATWGTDLNSIPDRFTDSAVTGLNVTASFLGYYDGTDWQAYISGTDGSGQLAGGDISWSATGSAAFTGSLTITGGSGISNLSDAGDLATLDSITNSEIDDATIEKAKLGTTVISGGFLETDLIAADSITASKIATDTLTANEIAANTITASEIAADTITASEIAAGTITASEIDANTITANELAANTITASEIAAGTITANEIDVSDLYSEDASISGKLTVGTSHFLDGTNDEVSFAGGILTADASSVGLASFAANSKGLSASVGSSGSARRIHADVDATNIDGTNHASDPVFSVWDQGTDIMVSMGNIYKAPSRTGFALFSDYTTAGEGTKVFEVSKDKVSGDLTARMAGLDFNEGALVTGDGNLTDGYTTGTVTGMQPGTSSTTKTVFGGADDEDGTNATWYAQRDGKFFYDALGGSILSATNYANSGLNADEPDSLEDDFWAITQSTSGTSDSNANVTKVKARYFHRFGINKLILQAKARYTRSTSGGSWNTTTRVGMRIKSSEAGGTIVSDSTVNIPQNSYGDITLELDGLGSNLTEGNYYIIEIYLSGSIDADIGNSGSDNITLNTYLREDIYLTTAT